MTWVLVAAGLVIAVIVWAEIVHWRSSRRLTGPDRGGSEAVVVLGYRNPRSDRANALKLTRIAASGLSTDRVHGLDELCGDEAWLFLTAVTPCTVAPGRTLRPGESWGVAPARNR